jgi:hypothetical protein
MTSRYTEQLERVKRYLGRFQKINDGQIHDQISQFYDDDIYAFFQNCYHLKDWIKNDSVCENWSEVEDLITNNTDLNICADLCNSLKHLTLTSHRSTENPSFGVTHVNLNIKDNVEIAITYTISTSSGEVDAFELAKRCVSAWEQYINDNATQP